jgi:cytosine/adenosine deaminase-related metal-dependent hydrolase
MLIKNASVLLGRNLEFIKSTNIKIHNERFTRIQPHLNPSRNENSFDCEGLLLIPGFVNCHTHIGDSIAKDITLEKSIDERIHPVSGVKSKILKRTNSKHLKNFMQNSCISMLKKGITTFVDFREGGLDGVLLLKEVLSEIPIRSIILGRLDYYQKYSELKENTPFPKEKTKDLELLLKKCDGLGISGANENSQSVLEYYSKTSKLRAIHSAETSTSVSISKKITGKSEVIRALNLRPHFMIHMTHASKSDLFAVSKKIRGIIVCPRANASLAEGIPKIDLMRKTGCTIALGTDNIMINSPDMFREMDYLWKVSMAVSKKIINPKEILKMATVNAGKILNKDIGLIENGKLADGIFINKHAIDLEPIHNVYASIVHRVSESDIKAVMIGGKIVYGKI